MIYIAGQKRNTFLDFEEKISENKFLNGTIYFIRNWKIYNIIIYSIYIYHAMMYLSEGAFSE